MGCVFELGVLFGCLTLSTAVSHSLKYLYVTTSGVPDVPDFTILGMVDDMVTIHYDSHTKKLEPKTQWMKDYMYPDYWYRQTQTALGAEQIFLGNMDIVKNRFNYSGAIPLRGKHVHTIQYMYGCQWDDESGQTDGYKNHGYDGEDFLSLDWKNRRWIASRNEALITGHKWNRVIPELQAHISYLQNDCIDWLKKYVQYGRDALGRKVPPKVSVFEKDSGMMCHATGFYPEGVMITWKRDGEEMQNDVNVGETLPNDDGTFQKRVVLTVSPEERKKSQYTCEVTHKSGKPIIITLAEEEGNILAIIIGCVTATVTVGAVVVIVIVSAVMKKIKREQKGYMKKNSKTDSVTSEPPIAVMKIKREQKGYMKKNSKTDSVTSESSTTELLKSGTGSLTSTESLSTDSTNSGTGSLTSTESLSTYSTKSE